MAATKSQGRDFTLFMAGLTAVCAGIAFFSSGAAKVALVLGLVAVVAISLGVLQDQASRGQDRRRRATRRDEADRRGGGAGGWLFVLFGLHLTASVGGRMVTSILGFAISLAGICYVLAPAVSKNAIWKA